MAHRIRYTMSQEPLSSKLNGIIEIDETYVGGKLRDWPYKHEAGRNDPRIAPSPLPTKLRLSLYYSAAVAFSLVMCERVTAAELEAYR